jgi:hypothetical protein
LANWHAARNLLAVGIVTEPKQLLLEHSSSMPIGRINTLAASQLLGRFIILAAGILLTMMTKFVDSNRFFFGMLLKIHTV